jgi:hypothetical protein
VEKLCRDRERRGWGGVCEGSTSVGDGGHGGGWD